MSTQEIMRVNPGQVDAFMPVMEIGHAVQRYNAVIEFTQKIMKDGKDFGTIPGVDKPSLLKPGAEKLCSFFGLSPKFSIVGKEEQWAGDEPFFYYWYKCELWRSDLLIAEGDGSCSSRESKYRYRWVSAENVPAHLAKDSLLKRKSSISEFGFAIEKAETGGKYGKPPEYWQAFRDAIQAGTAYKVRKQAKGGKQYDAWEMASTVYRVPNPDIADQVNTIQKMAQKRALIAATLIACNASEYYTQDVEDLVSVPGGYSTGETREEIVKRRVSEVKASAPTPPDSDPPSDDEDVQVVPLIVQEAWSKMTNIKSSCEIFAGVKKQLSTLLGEELAEAEYYRVLAAYGVEHANEFRQTQKARQCMRDLLAVLEGARKEQSDAA